MSDPTVNTPFRSAAYRTLNGEVERNGIGIHTGASSRVRLFPAPAGTGIVFRTQGQEISARAANVVDTSRCTVLGGSGMTVSTIEHLLSAFAGGGVTDALVEIEGPELPIGDGSSALWAEAIAEVGVLGEAAEGFSLTEPLVVTGKDGAFVAGYPSEALRLTVAVSFPQHPLVGTQVARFEPGRGEDYAREIAPARTFGFIEEVEALLAAGLAKGGSFDNAVVVYPDHYSVPLRYENELARHKLLDLMGDMMLCGAGVLPTLDVVAVRPSHRLNVAFAAALAERLATQSAG